MSAAVQTTTSLRKPSTSTHTLVLRPTVTPNGSLDAPEFSRHNLTPAIGTRFTGPIQIRRILESPNADAVISDIALLISQRGVVFFPNQDLTPQELTTFVEKVGRLSGRPASSGLHIHPLTAEFGENGDFVGKITSDGSDGRQISRPDDRSERDSSGWHSDITFEPVPSNYAALRMTVIPPEGGDTLWASAYSAYDTLSPAMQKFLESLTATHSAPEFKSQAERYGFPLRMGPRGAPENVGNHLTASHPVVRVNPVTGWKGLFVNKFFTERINELTRDESDNLLQYLFHHVSENHSSQVRYQWSINDLAIWDNRTTYHTGTFDYGDALRTGDRVCSLGEKPFFDAQFGVSRKADIANGGKVL